ncbi:hypothetical protein [Clostridium minihomine]|uniref:hypothetical protein n=1 Tax=Clostridium minihomine TaxID=2045012 RepID=UPI0013EC4BB9|nr:hypothetical protein [Clostridium minihomine]
MFEPRYSATTERLMSELSQHNDTSWGEYQDNGLFGLSESRTVVYVKHKDTILIYFPTWTNFSRSSGYVYYSNEIARDFWEHPSLYDSSLTEEVAYDSKEALQEKWDYIKIY